MTKTRSAFALSVLVTASLCLALPLRTPTLAQPAAKTLGTIERMDPRFDALIPKDAALEILVSDLDWVEGPVWSRPGKFVLFSNIPKNRVHKWQEGAGLSVFLEKSGYSGSTVFTGPEPGSNGLTFDPQGRLVLCQHGDRRIARLRADGTFETLVDRYEGKRINSPNDVIFKANGDMYFTDPPFGLPKAADDPGKETPWNGVYRLSKDGRLTLLTTAVRFPNGIGFSPDEKTLYISNAEHANPVWYAFEVKPDGTLGKSRVFAEAKAWVKPGEGVPDGLKVDAAGNVFGSGPGGLHVFAPDGTRLGLFKTGVKTANCAWGGEDGRMLYVTANTNLCRVRTTTKGAGF